MALGAAFRAPADGALDSDGPRSGQKLPASLLAAVGKARNQRLGYLGLSSNSAICPSVMTLDQPLTSQSLNRGNAQVGGRGLCEVIFVKSLPRARDLTDTGFFPSLSWAPLLSVPGP